MNLTAELIGRRGPEMEGVRVGRKVERPEYFDDGKTQDVDTWLFQVREHLDITVIPERGRIPYAASLFCGNATLWRRELCGANNRPRN